MVYYRKYRPQTISDLDSASLREKLNSIFSDLETISHAFLFTGPKGLGKTSTARIVAKVINCVRVSGVPKVPKVPRGNKKKTLDTPDTSDTLGTLSNIEPCNMCETCVSITNGTNMDVIEIDAASNRGIDEIRDLKEKVKLSPLSATKKVYIIDEVHMLTTEAFNALLKTLEEPPEHVVFVLCTTEPQKVPATILSRCSHIMFLPATKDELVRSFTRIARGEGLKIDKNVLEVIAELSDGGFRDGAKILEELVQISRGKEITPELVEEQYKMTSTTYQIQEMIKALSSQDTKSAVDIVEGLALHGIDVKFFLIRLLNALHNELLGLIGVTEKKNSDFTPNELQYLLSGFSKAFEETRFAIVPQIPLELAIVEWGSMSRNSPSASLRASAEPPFGFAQGERGTNGVTEVDVTTQTHSAYSRQEGGQAGQAVTLKTMRKNLGTMAKIKALYGDSAEQNTSDVQVKTAGVSLLQYDADTDTKEWTDTLWKSIISEMKTHNHTIAGVLRGCQLKSYDKKSIIIEALYKFHKEKLDEAKNMDALVGICRSLTGNPVSVSVVLKAK